MVCSRCGQLRLEVHGFGFRCRICGLVYKVESPRIELQTSETDERKMWCWWWWI